MRTKTLILSAVALAAGLASSLAQSNVYSVNVVGYVNVTVPAGYALIANTFTTGASNGVTEVINPAVLPFGATILQWNGAGFVGSQYAPGFNTPSTVFIDPDSQVDVATPTIPPGQGFFLQNPGSPFVATFTGTVVPNPSTTTTNTLPAGYGLVGSKLPVGGLATAVGTNTLNLNLVFGATLLTWNGSGFVGSQYAPGFNTGATIFIDPDSQVDVATPTLTVGQGFFYQNPGSSIPWGQALGF